MSITILGTEINRAGEEITIKLSDTLATNATLVTTFMRGVSNLIDNGWAIPFLIGNNSNKVIFAEINEQLAGMIVFDFQNDLPRTTWIYFGTTTVDFRARGVYHILHSSLERYAKESGSTQIQSFVHKNNTRMLELCKTLGKEQTFIRVEKKL
jgi:RimJ/RimL family protein N-acetyltransferase